MDTKNVRNVIEALVMFFALGVVMVGGIRTAEWVLGPPERLLMVCISEKERDYGHCTPFEDYLAK